MSPRPLASGHELAEEEVDVEYRVLGPLEVRADDGPLPLGGEKQRALLALLAA